MPLDEIKRLIEFIRAQDLTEFELEQDGVKIRIKSGAAHDHVPLHPAAPIVHPHPPAAAGFAGLAAGAPAIAVTGDSGEEEGTELAIVKSPIVGTFYRASDPEAKPFVDVGDTVKKGEIGRASCRERV